MEKKLYDEMVSTLNEIEKEMDLKIRTIFVFGHCSASLSLIDLLESREIKVSAIIDNSEAKQGQSYKGAVVIYPDQIKEYVNTFSSTDSIVLIVSRFYASMLQQLRKIGYRGVVRKVIDYNTYAEYSLSDVTIRRMKKREENGEEKLIALKKKYRNTFFVFCPFNALGDVYFMMSYWSLYAEKRGVKKVVFCVMNDALADVIHMFGNYCVEIFEQKNLDAMIQAALYTRANDCFVAHQDRPYVVNLAKVLYIKRIPLEQMYCSGVYGLSPDTKPVVPNKSRHPYKDIDSIPEGKSVIFSPYAKSVTSINTSVWEEAVSYYAREGYKCFTNVFGDEVPLSGTEPISPSLLEVCSVVERAGTFVGIRSGLCDIIREARAKKIALYPDYYYSDTKWKAIDMYKIKEFEYNLLATEPIKWNML